MLYQLKNDSDKILYEKDCKNLSECLESAVKEGKDLSNLTLEDAKIENIDISGAKLNSCGFKNVEFENVKFSGSTFGYTKSYNYKRPNTAIGNCSFKDCNFDKADLSHTAVYDTKFENTDMKEAKLFSINWNRVGVKGGDVSGMTIKYCADSMFNAGVAGIKFDGVGMDKMFPDTLRSLGSKIENEVISEPNLYRLFGKDEEQIFSCKADSLNQCLEKAAKQKANLGGLRLKDQKIENVNLSGLQMAGSRLENIEFKNVKLDNAKLYNKEAHFDSKMKNVSMENVSLRGAQLHSLKAKNCKFDNVDFKDTDQTFAVLDDCKVKNSDFRRVELFTYGSHRSGGRDNYFIGTTFENVKMEQTAPEFVEGFGAKNINPQFSDPKVYRLHDKEGKTLCEVSADNFSKALEKAVKSDVDLTHLSVLDQEIKSVDLSGAKMAGATFTNVKMYDVNFKDASFSSESGSITSPRMEKVDIDHCDFSDSNIESIKFNKSKIKNSSFKDAKIGYLYGSESKVESSDFRGAQFNDNISRHRAGIEASDIIIDDNISVKIQNAMKIISSSKDATSDEKYGTVSLGSKMKEFGKTGEAKAYPSGVKANSNRAYKGLKKMFSKLGVKTETVKRGEKENKVPSLIDKAIKDKLYGR